MTLHAVHAVHDEHAVPVKRHAVHAVFDGMLSVKEAAKQGTGGQTSPPRQGMIKLLVQRQSRAQPTAFGPRSTT